MSEAIYFWGENPIDLHSAAVCSYKAQCLRTSPVRRIPHCFTCSDSPTQEASVQDNLDDLTRGVAQGRGPSFPWEGLLDPCTFRNCSALPSLWMLQERRAGCALPSHPTPLYTCFMSLQSFGFELPHWLAGVHYQPPGSSSQGRLASFLQRLPPRPGSFLKSQAALNPIVYLWS